MALRKARRKGVERIHMQLSTLASGLNPNPSSGSSSSSSNLGHTLNESAFLKLLSAELKYQNPIHPMNNTQFVAELAQFSTLAASTKASTTLQQILTLLQHPGSGSNGLVAASHLIGKTVTTAQGQGTVQSVTLDQAGTVTAEVGGLGAVALKNIQSIA